MYTVVSGVTGVGKTTWAAALATAAGGLYLGEPVENSATFMFANARPTSTGARLLAQIHFFAIAVEQHVVARTAACDAFQDHSCYEVVEVYGRQLARTGALDVEDLGALRKALASAESVVPLPDCVLLLVASPAVVRIRLAERSRVSDVLPDDRELAHQHQRRERLWRRLEVPTLTLDTTEVSRPPRNGKHVAEVFRALRGIAESAL